MMFDAFPLRFELRTLHGQNADDSEVSMRDAMIPQGQPQPQPNGSHCISSFRSGYRPSLVSACVRDVFGDVLPTPCDRVRTSS